MNYANKNLENTKLFESKMICADIQEVELATDNGGEVLKQQIIDYEKNYFGKTCSRDIRIFFYTDGRDLSQVAWLDLCTRHPWCPRQKTQPVHA